MKIKIFQALGKTAIDELENQINEWLENQPGEIEIKNTQITATGISGSPTEELYQTLIVCVWYENSN